MEIQIPASVIHSLMRMRQQDRVASFILINVTEIHFQALKANRKLVAIPDDMDEFAELLWNSLNEDNKVSLFVRYIDIETGKYESKIINKNK